MTLITIILAFVLGRIIGDASKLIDFDWFHDLINWLEKHLSGYRIWDSPAGVLITVAIPMLVLALLLHLLNDFFSPFAFILSAVILYICMSYESFDRSVEIYRNALDDDSDAAIEDSAERILGKDIFQSERNDFISVIQSLFRQSNDRVFAILFWFVVLGPLGALLYKLVNEILYQRYDIHGPYTQSTRDLHEILTWPSTRLTIIGFALVGSLIHTIDKWRESDQFNLTENETLIPDCGLAAIACNDMDLDEVENQIYCLDHSSGLVKRSLIFWLTLIAISTISGWTG